MAPRLDRLSAAVILADEQGRPRPFECIVPEPALKEMRLIEEADLSELGQLVGEA